MVLSNYGLAVKYRKNLKQQAVGRYLISFYRLYRVNVFILFVFFFFVCIK